MSKLYPIVEDIISLMNNKYGTDISAEQVLTAYTPKLDEDKKEFTKEDIKWLADILMSHSLGGGVRGLVKRMDGKFNNDLKQTILDAGRKYGELKGVAKFLSDYDNLKKTLPKGKPSQPTIQTNKLEVAKPVGVIKKYLGKVKAQHPKDYEGSFFDHTENVLDMVQKVQRSNESLNPKEQQALLSLFASNSETIKENGENVDISKPGLMKGWRKLNVRGITQAVKELFDELSNYSEAEKIDKDDIVNPKETKPSGPLGKAVLNLARTNTKEVSEKDMEINKEMKGEKRDKVKEETKDVGAKDKYTYASNIVKKYLKEAKSAFSKDFNKTGSLHKFTEELVSLTEDYLAGEGRDNATNKRISSIFSDTPGILDKWDEIHKPMAKRLRELRSSFNAEAKTKAKDKSPVSKEILNKIDELQGKPMLQATKEDKAIAKAMIGKREKEKPDQGTEIDPTFFNKLIKELVKHKDDLPKKPMAKDLESLDLTEEERAIAKADEYLHLMSKAMQAVDVILQEDDGVSDEDLATKVLNRLKKEKSDKNKKSSTNIISNYMDSIFYKLERLANISNDKLVKAELENIVQDIKGIL